MHNKHTRKLLHSQASVAEACGSHGRDKIVLEEGEHMGSMRNLLMFALFEDVL